jgi:hypothetical protein
MVKIVYKYLILIRNKIMHLFFFLRNKFFISYMWPHISKINIKYKECLTQFIDNIENKKSDISVIYVIFRLTKKRNMLSNLLDKSDIRVIYVLFRIIKKRNRLNNLLDKSKLFYLKKTIEQIRNFDLKKAIQELKNYDYNAKVTRMTIFVLDSCHNQLCHIDYALWDRPDNMGRESKPFRPFSITKICRADFLKMMAQLSLKKKIKKFFVVLLLRCFLFFCKNYIYFYYAAMVYARLAFVLFAIVIILHWLGY